MINLNKKDFVADAVNSVMQQEEINIKKRTYDDLGGRRVSTQPDDMAPGAKFIPSKVKFHAGPDADNTGEPASTEKDSTETKQLSAAGASVKTTKPVSRDPGDVNAAAANKKLGMKEAVSLKSFKTRYEENSIIDQMIAEVLSKDASAGDWIHDFVHSDNPKFKGKSKEQRKKQARSEEHTSELQSH